MAPQDRDSWLLRNAYPSGHASGWRRTGCLVMLVGGLILIALVLIVATVA